MRKPVTYSSMDLAVQLKNVRARKRKAVAKVLTLAQHRLAVWGLSIAEMPTRRDLATITDLFNDVHGEALRAVAALSKLVDDERRLLLAWKAASKAETSP